MRASRAFQVSEPVDHGDLNGSSRTCQLSVNPWSEVRAKKGEDKPHDLSSCESLFGNAVEMGVRAKDDGVSGDGGTRDKTTLSTAAPSHASGVERVNIE